MDLKSRLSLLRGQGGAAPASASAAPPPLEPGSSLRERLARITPHATSPVTASRRSDEQTARLLGGQIVAPGLILVETRIPLSHVHGNQSLAALGKAPFHCLTGIEGIAADSLLFLDTETTGLAGGTGTLPFLLGLARLTGQHFHLRQFFLTGFGGEVALLAEALPWYEAAEHLVTFNGKRFDLPLLATRYRLSRQPDPFRRLGHIDLLYPTRRAFSANWPDCRLQTAERRLLGFSRLDDLPGHLVPQAWFDFIRQGISHRVPGILEHNRWDLVSLAALAASLCHIYESPGRHPEADALAVARDLENRGEAAAAQAHLEAEENHLRPEGLLELARLNRRQGAWNEAVRLWGQLAAQDNLEALEHLAKYHEHVRRDLPAALEAVRRLRTLDGRNPVHIHRENRLLNKLGRK